MKKLFAVLCLGLAASSVLAQRQPKVEILRFEATCGSAQTMTSVLREFGEKPTLTLVSNREINGDIVAFPSMFFVNFETKTWTLVEQVTKTKFCVTATGEDITPYTKQ